MYGSRYVIRGLIDGSLSVLGVVIGALNPDTSVIIAAGLAGSFANGFSNLLAAFTAEYAERYNILKDIEEAMTITLRKTIKEREVKRAVRHVAVGDAVASIIGGGLPVLPFFFLSAFEAVSVSILMILLIMAGLGVIVGRSARQSIIMTIGKMIAFTAATAIVSFGVRQIVGS